MCLHHQARFCFPRPTIRMRMSVEDRRNDRCALAPDPPRISRFLARSGELGFDCEFGSVASEVLRAIQCVVRQVNKLLWIERFGGAADGNPAARRDRQRALSVSMGPDLSELRIPLPHCDRSGTVAGTRDHDELLAPVPAYGIVWADATGHATRHLFQHGIAGRMPARIIDAFEMVQINQNDGEAPSSRRCRECSLAISSRTTRRLARRSAHRARKKAGLLPRGDQAILKV